MIDDTEQVSAYALPLFVFHLGQFLQSLLRHKERFSFVGRKRRKKEL